MKLVIGKNLLILFSCFIIMYILVIKSVDKFSDVLKVKKFIFNVCQETVTYPQTTVTKKRRVIDENDVSCYNEISDPDGLMELDYSNEKDGPTLGKTIFFHETSCFEDQGLLLNPRQACAAESAAKMNPNMDVYLLYLSASKISKSAQEMIRYLSSYKNIKIRRIHVDKYMENTPLEKWYASGILKTSKWPRSHMSDILRYLTLWKYGGIYLDLDIVVIKCLENLENFTGAQETEIVAAGVIGFGMGELGRKMANYTITNLKRDFLGWSWGHNGPGVITRTLQNLCNVTSTQNMIKDRCEGFEVFPPSAFYPIYYPSWKKYFEEDNKNETMKTIENSKAIHVWNKFSQFEKIKVGTNVPYAKIAEKYCPKTYKNCGTIF